MDRVNESMLGRWDPWHGQVLDPTPYADTVTYQLGAEFLSPCSKIEDWGCGLGWFKTLVHPPERYVGVDGTRGPCTDKIVDLVKYKSKTPGLFMRHVLEHNWAWRWILDNALESFTQRMVLVLFTPMAEHATHEIAWYEQLRVPDISFTEKDIHDRFPEEVDWHFEDLRTPSQYGVERIYCLAR